MIKFFSNVIVKLLLGVVVGIVLGGVANHNVMVVVLPLQYILGQLIFFMVPLIILGFVAPAITKLKGNASKMLGVAMLIAYSSSICAALFSMFLGYEIIPMLDIQPVTESGPKLPELLFKLEIPPVMSVMSALVISLMLGMAVLWTKSEAFSKLLSDFQDIVLALVNRVLIPILPFFVAANFSVLSYRGELSNQLPVFLKIIVIIIFFHFLWLCILYGLAGLYSKKNPWLVIKHYGPTYMTAIGTMSSAATLGVALKSAKKSNILRDDVTDFSIPLFANIHLCGSVLTEVFFVLTVSLLLYGTLPSLLTMVVFIFLLGIFAIGAPGVPGGTVMASLGLVVSLLGFDATGTALLLTIYALQDSFGTACNITGDGALSLMLTTYANNSEKKVSG